MSFSKILATGTQSALIEVLEKIANFLNQFEEQYMKKLSAFVKPLLAVALLSGAAISANATPILGTFNLTLGQVAISLGNIDWNRTAVAGSLNPPPNLANVTTGPFQVNELLTDSFVGLAGSPGTIRDMADPILKPLETGNAFAIGVASQITNFMKLGPIAPASWQFDATYMAPGTIIAGSTTPYSLFQIPNDGVSATIGIDGYACPADSNLDGKCTLADVDVTQWHGTFSAQYPGKKIADLSAIILAGGTLQNNTWSGTVVVTPVPEPASLSLVGLGLLGLAFARRRSSK